MTDEQLDILRFVRKMNNQGEPLTEDELPLMTEAFGRSFKALCDDGFVTWCEVADEIWYYPTEKGNDALSVADGQLALPGLEQS